MTFLLQLTTIFLAAALQAWLPAIWGLRIEFLPALVAWYSFDVSRRRAITLAVIAGCAQDALSAAPFGLTAVAYVVAALVITGLRDVLARELPQVQLAAGAFTSLLCSLAAMCVIGVSFGALVKLAILAGLAGVLAVILITGYELLR